MLLTGADQVADQHQNDTLSGSALQDEALGRYSVSREVPRSILKYKTVLGTLDAKTAPKGTGGNPEQERGQSGGLRGKAGGGLWAAPPPAVTCWSLGSCQAIFSWRNKSQGGSCALDLTPFSTTLSFYGTRDSRTPLTGSAMVTKSQSTHIQ